MEKLCEQIKEHVLVTQQRIAQAAAKAGRSADDITLLGVTKTQSAEAVACLLQAGVSEIGENRVQELLDKAPALAEYPHKAHLIGHLQRNKAKYLPGHVDMIQSVDREETVVALEKAYLAHKSSVDVLIQVNIGDEQSKSGVDVEGLSTLVERVLQSEQLHLRGLMAIPPICEGDMVRRYFAQMYQLFIDIQAKNSNNKTINILSMGMSADFDYAIMEGATMVRVGTDLFGPRLYV